ncbi:hypothetical protein SISSUDRAFT_1066882 [Sistotremastrum suecicum HHB10207 ss-3]|uniref:F-box domain-containing protein n=1 Tax=Sistotremastrum suecicum HHB10207 ss-3 TaxID=1314776 RepID=A0A165XSM5_9AGAM|nr:hypothetical protein SISSUDRAFT_1066882 [Sistotremastrum suecicum HHB10207 ss-3]
MSSEPVEPAVTSLRTSPRIPPELILDIFEIASSDMSTLLTICLVSKSYCQFFRSLLQRSVRFRSAEAYDAFKQATFEKSLVQDVSFVLNPSSSMQVDLADFAGCSGLRALGLTNTQIEDPSKATMYWNDSFERIIEMFMPMHVLLGSMNWHSGIRDPGPDSPSHSLRSITHLTFTLASSGRISSLNLSKFGSLTHVCIRINMRHWSSDFGDNLRTGFPVLEERGINSLISIHHFLPIPEPMVLRLMKRYANPHNSLNCLRIKVEPNEGLDLGCLRWHDVLQRHCR